MKVMMTSVITWNLMLLCISPLCKLKTYITEQKRQHLIYTRTWVNIKLSQLNLASSNPAESLPDKHPDDCPQLPAYKSYECVVIL